LHSLRHDHRCASVLLFSDTHAPAIYTLSLHDALPIWSASSRCLGRTSQLSKEKNATSSGRWTGPAVLPIQGITHRTERCGKAVRSEEHTSELQSRFDLVCRLLLEKKNKQRLLIQHQDA